MMKNKTLIGGMDVSGTNDNYKYLAIVIGQQSNLNSLHKKLGQPIIHMSSQPKRGKQTIIISNLIRKIVSLSVYE